MFIWYQICEVYQNCANFTHFPEDSFMAETILGKPGFLLAESLFLKIGIDSMQG